MVLTGTGIDIIACMKTQLNTAATLAYIPANNKRKKTYEKVIPNDWFNKQKKPKNYNKTINGRKNSSHGTFRHAPLGSPDGQVFNQ